mmetsp:Transcript_7892/g.17066  ORF Transcript_7892/g.17066 Transcript_7892/m.17066 type:complete len:276 (+) Transcript_7892:333-1160(+)
MRRGREREEPGRRHDGTAAVVHGQSKAQRSERIVAPRERPRRPTPQRQRRHEPDDPGGEEIVPRPVLLRPGGGPRHGRVPHPLPVPLRPARGQVPSGGGPSPGRGASERRVLQEGEQRGGAAVVDVRVVSDKAPRRRPGQRQQAPEPGSVPEGDHQQVRDVRVHGGDGGLRLASAEQDRPRRRHVRRTILQGALPLPSGNGSVRQGPLRRPADAQDDDRRPLRRNDRRSGTERTIKIGEARLATAATGRRRRRSRRTGPNAANGPRPSSSEPPPR